MNAKHYVSLEVAKMLKEKGFNEECDYCFYYDDYDDKWEFDYPHNLFDDEPMHYNNETIDDEMYSMPSLLDAMDWLEERGIRISIKYDWIECGWYYIVIDGTPTVKNITEVEKSDGIFYKDRNECMNAAIKEGLELL